jgi:prepilin-type processing-associated H-X9-DG protein/prepilin-type N-terminal cleavage/methylation domain-containing protein
VASAVTLSVVFVFAAMSKLLTVGDFVSYSHQISFIPPSFATFVGVGVVSIEVFVAFLLISDTTRRLGFATALVTLTGFTAFLLWAVFDPSIDSCACFVGDFPGLSADFGERYALVRNVALLTVAFVGLHNSETKPQAGSKYKIDRARVEPDRPLSLQADQNGRIGAPAFTLVELIVVIGIVGLLLAILLPVLSAARSAGQSVTCLSNLRQQHGVLTQWANDHHGVLPLHGYAIVPPGTAGSGSLPPALNDSGRQRYAYHPTDFPTSTIPFREMPVSLTLALAKRITGVPEVSDLGIPGRWETTTRVKHPAVELLHCPAAGRHLRADKATPTGATGLTVGTGLIGYQDPWWNTTSYALNAGLLGFHYDTDFRHRRYNGFLARVRGASQMVITGDSDNWGLTWLPALDHEHENMTLRDAFLRNSQLAWSSLHHSRVDPTRHLGRLNLLFVDGHASAVAVGDDGDGLDEAWLLRGLSTAAN